MAKYKNDLRCSFCGKTQDEVRKLIAGPDGVFICNDCVDICVGIIEEEFKEKIATIAENAVGDACTGSNPRPIDPATMEKLFTYIYYGKEVDF